ncbi:hypothetical protein D5F01_LYC02609 [Larimichthys crocea]|uniref:Uncharacterized protein n=1 Tax=Larimichthys crocea TaxID=215358 RepID=A0A6G0J3K9_LARCR|nr:hypothetical protein D5F01_LYC02609 [Larimichthys crocea]
MDRNIDVYQESYYLNIEVNALQKKLKEAIGNRKHDIETQEPQELKKEEGLSAQCVAEEVLQGNEAPKGEIQSLQVVVENDRPDTVQVQGLQEVRANQNINERILQELKKEEGLSALSEGQKSLKSEPLTSDQQEMHDINQLLEMNKILKENNGRLQQVIPDLSNNMFVVKEGLGQVLQGNEAPKGEIQRLQVMVENDRPDSVQVQGLQEVQANQNINERILQELQELKKEESHSALRDEQESLKSEPLTSDQQEMTEANQQVQADEKIDEKIVQEVQEEGHSGHREDQESLENKPLRRFFVRLFGMRKMRKILSWRPTWRFSCISATV